MDNYLVNSYPQPHRFQPSFFRFPIQNNRTGWQPVWTPTMLVVPWYRDWFGNAIDCSEVTEVTFSINRSSVAPVAGHVNGPHALDTFNPDYNIYRITLTDLPVVIPEEFGRQDELSKYLVNVDGTTKYIRKLSSTNSIEISPEEAKEGDYLRYMLNKGTEGDVIYYPDAIYYDLSMIEIPTVDLPVGWYNFVWQAKFYKRVYNNDQFICIDCNDESVATMVYPLNHPGDVHENMRTGTPQLYFDDVSLDKDNTVKLYRPFSDVLQDLYDEQTLMRGINWVDRIPAQLLPYLAYLVGVDLPHFSNIDLTTNDKIRKKILERGAYIQRLKGSRRAITELFAIFGFTIDLVKLWSTTDGEFFIAPGERLPDQYSDQTIETTTICQTEPLVLNYSTDGWGDIEMPLMYMNLEDKLEINVFEVENGSTAAQRLEELHGMLSCFDYTRDDSGECCEDCEPYVVETPNIECDDCGTAQDPDILSHSCLYDVDGYPVPCKLFNYFEDGNFDSIECDRNVSGFPDGVLGYSNLIITDIEVLKETHYKDGLFKPDGSRKTQTNIKYDKILNKLNITFPRYKEFIDSSLYIFVTYQRQHINVPEALQSPKDLRTNRFDVHVSGREDEDVDFSIYQWLLMSVLRTKAFHSLLRKMVVTRHLLDVYNVTDFCESGSLSNKYTNELETPPATPPVDRGDDDEYDCGDILTRVREEDLALKNRILKALEEEYQAWRDTYAGQDGSIAIPGTGGHRVPSEQREYLQSKSIIPISEPDYESMATPEGGYNYLGQDRLSGYLIAENVTPAERNLVAEGSTLRYVVTQSAVDDLWFKTDDENGYVFRTVPIDHIIVPPIPEGHYLDLTVEKIFGGRQYYFRIDNNFGDLDCDCEAGVSVDNDYEDVRSKLIDVDISPLPDYCYNGRVKDKLAPHIDLKPVDRVRCRPCELMGLGNYYFANMDPKVNPECWVYGEEDLHYSNSDFLELVPKFDQHRPDMDIDYTSNFMPGHRFISMENLEGDFIHPDHKARPWDFVGINYQHDRRGIECHRVELFDNPLNARIETRAESGPCGIEETEYLVYDEDDLIYAGNGIPADIPSNGGSSSSLMFTHSIYTFGDDNPYVTQESVDILTTTATQGFIYVATPLFKSANINFVSGNPLGRLTTEDGKYIKTEDDKYIVVNSGNLCDRLINIDLGVTHAILETEDGKPITTEDGKIIIVSVPTSVIDGEVQVPGYRDYIDGYPADWGMFSVDATTIWSRRECEDGCVLIDTDSSELVTVDATFGSGIPTDLCMYEGRRNDCGCLETPCSESEATIAGCNLEFWENPDGSHDFNCEKIEVERVMLLREKVNTSCMRADEIIKDLLNLNDEYITETTDGRSGFITFVDDYDAMYKLSFVIEDIDEDNVSHIIHLSSETFDPRVWGESPYGFIEGREIYKRGIVTKSYQDITVYSNGLYEISEDISTDDYGYIDYAKHQYVAHKQINFLCCNEDCDDSIDQVSGVFGLLDDDGNIITTEDGFEIFGEVGADVVTADSGLLTEDSDVLTTEDDYVIAASLPLGSNFICEDMGHDALFQDHADHAVCDDIEVDVLVGPRWTDWNEEGPYWIDPDGTDSGFEFINVWNYQEPDVFTVYEIDKIGFIGTAHDDSNECCEWLNTSQEILCWKFYKNKWVPVYHCVTEEPVPIETYDIQVVSGGINFNMLSENDDIILTEDGAVLLGEAQESGRHLFIQAVSYGDNDYSYQPTGDVRITISSVDSTSSVVDFVTGWTNGSTVYFTDNAAVAMNEDDEALITEDDEVIIFDAPVTSDFPNGLYEITVEDLDTGRTTTVERYIG